MKKIAIIYWSGTGNTEIMAEAILAGALSAGAEASLYKVEDISVEKALEFDQLVLGCPSMGAEVLEEIDFEPFFTSLEGKLSGKNVALFGSYGWGDGEWMRDWQTRVETSGAKLFEEGLMINETPDDEGVSICKAFGERIASA
ncbi:MAG TPA: flavodoxin [Clostridiales bacterium UBA8960]|nr:flavodoxin [Clostridiales bacterium UBA8960]